ncbi:MAG: hypothetical protein C4524_05670 [Candidatus Zixiibacteriota bacterium]|nr:MAG: hypothetical protein C4524_05670 [candidate division Zixibacteria bacterium]
MRILLLNDAYFLPSLRNMGHTVVFASLAPGSDLALGPDPVPLSQVLEACPFDPDVILYSDSIDLRLAFLGWEKVEVPTVFYGIDSPMNRFWQFDLAQVFDLTFLDQKASVERLATERPELKDRVHWLPLAADPAVYRKLPLEKTYDIGFVGTLNSRLRPKRSWIIEELKRHFTVTVFEGQGRRALPPENVAAIYNQSRLVLNENLSPGLNLRLFEAMACGSCLLTEASDGSWAELFKDMEHLAVYTPETLVDRAAGLLADDVRREAIAEQGRAEVLDKHTIAARTRVLLRHLAPLARRRNVELNRSRRAFFLGRACLNLAHRWPQQPVGKLGPEGVKLLYSQARAGLESADLHFEMASQALQEKRRSHALASLRRALQLDPTHLRSLWALFWCLRESGDPLGASAEISRLGQHLRRKASVGFLRRAAAGADLIARDYLYLGRLLEKAGWLYEPGTDRFRGHPARWNAFDACQMAISLDPDLAPAYVKCADLMEALSCPDFAALFLAKAVNLEPRNPELRFRFSRLLRESYRRRESLDQLLNYLFLSTEADKWERVVALNLPEPEWNFLLESVWRLSRQPVDKLDRPAVEAVLKSAATTIT